MQKHILFAQKVRKYQGKYIAVKGEQVIASGKSAKEAFSIGKKLLRTKMPDGVYYIPTKKDLLTALCVSLISN